MIAVFSAPLDLLWSRPVLAVPAPRSQDMRIKYMFIVQRYDWCRPLPAGFCTANVVSDTHRRVGVSDPEGRGRLPADQIVEDAAPGVTALSAHALTAREQHLLTIRTPMTTSSEIAVALWSSRMSNTVPSRMPHNRLVGQRTSIPGVPVGLHLARNPADRVLLTAPPNIAFKARRTGAVGDDTGAGGRARLDRPLTRVRRTGRARSLYGNTVGALTWRGAGAWKCWSAVARGN
jgi:hypothetical protein